MRRACLPARPPARAVFDSPTPFDILGSGYQRPFELATLRLFNMMGIIPKCARESATGRPARARPSLTYALSATPA